MSFKPAILIPVYNHENAISQIVEQALVYGYPILLVDDGSNEACRDVLLALSEKFADRVELLRLEKNSGKGAAVRAGFSYLLEAGFSHALQVDADGQHELTDLPLFIDQGKNNQTTLITGYPKFDDSVPKARYYSRYLTHIWVWINTLSFSIKDTMCGYRLYPLAPVCELLSRQSCGDRMSFDTEVLVRWYWQGGQLINIPTKVKYPLDGVSHFDVWIDNVNISRMHARLFFGMLRRFPQLILRKFGG